MTKQDTAVPVIIQRESSIARGDRKNDEDVREGAPVAQKGS